jgi:hypothetical protein
MQGVQRLPMKNEAPRFMIQTRTQKTRTWVRA